MSSHLKSLHDIHRATFPAAELLIGMGLTQTIATLQVYASNRRLFSQMAAVAAAGFLPVPSPEVVPALLGLGTAAAGGLLFTLSLGAGLSFLGAAAGWWQASWKPRSRLEEAWPVGLLAVLLLFLNSSGFDPWASVYALVIPPSVFCLTRRVFSGPAPLMDRTFWRWRILPLALLALGWTIQYEPGLFIDLRDHLLMSNAAGQRASAFYYRYTPYPTEILNPLDKKPIRTVAWPDGLPPPPQVRQALIRIDCLPVASAGNADFVIRMKGDRMVFVRNDRDILEITAERFLAEPWKALTEVSKNSDTRSFFRALTYYGILLAFPTTLYCLLFAGLRVLFGIVAKDRPAEIFSATACILVGFSILAFFHDHRHPAPQPVRWTAALDSDAWPDRVAALKEIGRRQLDVCAFSAYDRMRSSPYPQERYWLARALAVSASPAASAGLTRLLDDPHINVRTQAVEAIAQRGDRGAVRGILKRLQASQDWYFQVYAYRALRALKWNQTASH